MKSLHPKLTNTLMTLCVSALLLPCSSRKPPSCRLPYLKEKSICSALPPLSASCSLLCEFLGIFLPVSFPCTSRRLLPKLQLRFLLLNPSFTSFCQFSIEIESSVLCE
ncbi:hypothetical protein SLEP1_g30312 [Rubroshorea leprosula]|uniref:Secreted protein n=1 Tax=Rubroshorea leprosula TaxID=152421 RepID=A0AAV5K5E1_9ROSI|nr:hypothetical protein SLEP1_g30312 [Rubroshorea leprosula]